MTKPIILETIKVKFGREERGEKPKNRSLSKTIPAELPCGQFLQVINNTVHALYSRESSETEHRQIITIKFIKIYLVTKLLPKINILFM